MPRVPIMNYGIWLNLDKALDKRKAIDQWVDSLMMSSALTLGKFEAPDLQVYYETTLTGVAKKYYLSFKETARGRDWLEEIQNSKSPYDFAVPLYNQFCEDLSNLSEKTKETAKSNIYALKIFDMHEIF
ncbi:hypothetical protein RchiOBHm_Chr3g0487531 [Rosa chinensis]|uniref:Uncharacterized protein n=1 Tax=Rosa chinensis TaxID=74649 RepID=A0A2P6RFI8_ROSCH|nr:hypothetical protein RchiOBHm_Chr3g0487531 [Rosa chinensis]